jgi:hypothetical protein
MCRLVRWEQVMGPFPTKVPRLEFVTDNNRKQVCSKVAGKDALTTIDGTAGTWSFFEPQL